MNLLEVKNIKKSFDDLEVLKDISMSVAESEVISILGPSGSGKSVSYTHLDVYKRQDLASRIFIQVMEPIRSGTGISWAAQIMECLIRLRICG